MERKDQQDEDQHRTKLKGNSDNKSLVGKTDCSSGTQEGHLTEFTSIPTYHTLTVAETTHLKKKRRNEWSS